MIATVIHVEEYLFQIIFVIIAIAALILMIGSVIRLIISPKERRKKLKKTKITACVSAVLVTVITVMAICSLPPSDPPPPPVEVMIPDLTGSDYEECKEKYDGYLNLTIEGREYSSEYPEGTIIAQYPLSGFRLTSEVRCIVSAGVRMVTVPNLIGIDFETAEEICGDDIVLEIESEEYSDEYPTGKLISTSPEWNEKIEFGGTVKCVISKENEADISE